MCDSVLVSGRERRMAMARKLGQQMIGDSALVAGKEGLMATARELDCDSSLVARKDNE